MYFLIKLFYIPASIYGMLYNMNWIQCYKKAGRFNYIAHLNQRNKNTLGVKLSG